MQIATQIPHFKILKVGPRKIYIMYPMEAVSKMETNLCGAFLNSSQISAQISVAIVQYFFEYGRNMPLSSIS